MTQSSETPNKVDFLEVKKNQSIGISVEISATYKFIFFLVYRLFSFIRRHLKKNKQEKKEIKFHGGIF